MRSIEAQNRAFSERLLLNHQLLQKKYWFLPVDDTGHENYMPVGRGVVSSALCALWVGLSVCKDVEAHDGVFVEGINCTGKIIIRHNHLWCHKSSCPKCFIRGWSVRGARGIDGRLTEGVKRGFGKVEHVTVSVAVADRDLPEPIMRQKSRDALADRGGVVDGSMIFHAYRIDDDRHVLVFEPHYHCLCMIGNSFDRCRICPHVREDCASCDGFKGREVRGYKKDLYIVKVHPARKTIFGSAHYLLNHSTIRVGVKRFHSITYFGRCACRCYGSPLAVSKIVCCACEKEMVKSVYVGKRHMVKDIGSPNYVPWFAEDESEASNYIDVEELGNDGFDDFDEYSERNSFDGVGGRGIE